MQLILKRIFAIFLAVLLTIFIIPIVFAAVYTAPAVSQALIGQIQYSKGNEGAAADVAQSYNVGYNALAYANPHLNIAKLSSGTPVKLPTQHLLPNNTREGIVVNLPEMRMYYYLPTSNQILTYPIGIGKIGNTIPIREAIITYKKTNPTWTPPDSIREFNLKQGIILPKVMPPGPDNPLGPYAIYISIPTFLIHSTIVPESIGKRASFGCIRMYRSDIEQIFPMVSRGIPIAIINKPVKIGWQDDVLYLEAHRALEEHHDAYDASLAGMVDAVSQMATDAHQPVLVDWQGIIYLAHERDGMPHEIGVKIPLE